MRKPRSITQEAIESVINGNAKLRHELATEPRRTRLRWIEAWMRVEHPTLDALTPEQFAREVDIAALCAMRATERENEQLAATYGLNEGSGA